MLWLSLAEIAPPGAASRVQVLAHVVPRFSNVAFVSVLVLLASGTGATIVHMPAVNALWDTGYGVAILVKIGLLTAAWCWPRRICCGPSRACWPRASGRRVARRPRCCGG